MWLDRQGHIFNHTFWLFVAFYPSWQERWEHILTHVVIDSVVVVSHHSEQHRQVSHLQLALLLRLHHRERVNVSGFVGGQQLVLGLTEPEGGAPPHHEPVRHTHYSHTCQMCYLYGEAVTGGQTWCWCSAMMAHSQAETAVCCRQSAPAAFQTERRWRRELYHFLFPLSRHHWRQWRETTAVKVFMLYFIFLELLSFESHMSPFLLFNSDKCFYIFRSHNNKCFSCDFKDQYWSHVVNIQTSALTGVMFLFSPVVFILRVLRPLLSSAAVEHKRFSARK